jgi:hypothetical protein
MCIKLFGNHDAYSDRTEKRIRNGFSPLSQSFFWRCSQLVSLCESPGCVRLAFFRRTHDQGAGWRVCTGRDRLKFALSCLPGPGHGKSANSADSTIQTALTMFRHNFQPDQNRRCHSIPSANVKCRSHIETNHTVIWQVDKLRRIPGKFGFSNSHRKQYFFLIAYRKSRNLKTNWSGCYTDVRFLTFGQTGWMQSK